LAYKVFISHSTRDRGSVISLAHLLSRFGVEPYVASWYLTPGERIDDKVFQQIKVSDCVVALLTQDGMRSNWVNQEIGYAISEGRQVIPLVQKGTDPSYLGALQGREYIEYDPREPQGALLTTSSYLESLKLKKEEREKALLVAGGILAFFLLLSEGEK
jgi:nucleoside 2-deoxyribosyltransferase